MNSRTNRRTGVLIAPLLLAGCVVGPNYRAPSPITLGVPAAYAPPVTATADAGKAATAAQAPDLATWWRQLDDPMLSDLIATATASNLQIAQSLARLAQAREARLQAGADLLPTLTGSTSAADNFTHIAGRTSSSRQLSLGADASWQADLFGGLTRGVQAARGEEAAAVFDLEGVRTSIAGDVATNYIDARLAQARLVIARSTLSTQDDNLQIARWRVEAGLVSALDVEQARAQRAQTAASIPALASSSSRGTTISAGRPAAPSASSLAGAGFASAPIKPANRQSSRTSRV